MDNLLFVTEVESSQDLLDVVSGFVLVKIVFGNDVIKELSSIQTARRYIIILCWTTYLFRTPRSVQDTSTC